MLKLLPINVARSSHFGLILSVVLPGIARRMRTPNTYTTKHMGFRIVRYS